MCKWITIELREEYINSRNGKSARLRFPPWIWQMPGASFYVPEGFIKSLYLGTFTLCMPADKIIKVRYRRDEDFVEETEWCEKDFTPEQLKKFVYERDGHNGLEPFDYKYEAPELKPEPSVVLDELKDE